ncbi:MAG: peptidase [Flaviaesturariibacter sp.]|nr:peptidase [Flaviaesturariibacter sp.]
MNANNFEERVRGYAGAFHPVVPVTDSDRFLRMDFTEANPDLTDDVLRDTGRFSAYVASRLAAAGATYGIGGYNEHRTIYKRSHVFDTAADEPRRLHLGIDVWSPAGTPVYAPLEGTVHSFAFNDAYGDYGATLILQHEVDGLLFHTLYGHLSLASIEGKKEGEDIAKGSWIASFGEPAENGQWPPHLHFQLVIDMGEVRGDYPGVCRYSERDRFLDNCPDPDTILGLMNRAESER